MNEYEVLMEQVPGLREELPGVSERVHAIVKAELRESFGVVNSALDTEVDALVKKLDMDEDESGLMRKLVKQDLISVNDNMSRIIAEIFDKLKK